MTVDHTIGWEDSVHVMSQLGIAAPEGNVGGHFEAWAPTTRAAHITMHCHFVDMLNHLGIDWKKVDPRLPPVVPDEDIVDIGGGDAP